MSMLPRSPLAVAAAALLAAACMTPNYTADFATNDVFYVDVPFRTKAPGDRAVFLAPVVDARDNAALPTQEKGFPISYGGDDFWERPVTEMLGEVLARQLGDSALFPQLVAKPTGDDLIVKPTLVSFTNGATEAIFGSRSFAEVALRLQVFGPADGTGARPLLHEQVYGNRQLSATEVNPPSPYRLIGRALQLTIAKALTGLDGSNVARRHVPAELGAPAEAAATPAAPPAR